MKNRFFSFARTTLVVAACLVAGSAFAASYTGSLSYVADVEDGWYADAANDNIGWRKSSVLTWTVSNEEEGSPGEGFDWFYSYTMNVDKFATTRWMIETGEGLTAEDIDGVSVSGPDSSQDYSWSVGSWTSEDDLREMPEERYGIRFLGTSAGGNTTEGEITVSFWSVYEPQWGDLYANCGGHGNLGYNLGFTSARPTDALSSGSIDDHVIVPIPEPGSAMLVLMLAGGGLAGRRLLRRRRGWAGAPPNARTVPSTPPPLPDGTPEQDAFRMKCLDWLGLG